MSKTYSAGIVTAYGAAKRAGYQGTYEDFCRQQAGYAGNAAAVEAAKTAAQAAANTASTKASEATTAATAAQTAKTQTEAAASQALTDISTAESGAISAVQTEGATQTANATAQAQAAATSATTASTKASEASASATTATTKATEAAASATSAANAASAAQGVLESIPEDYSDLSEDVDQLKADLDDVIDEIGLYIPPETSGTTEASSSQQTIISNTPWVNGHSYTIAFTIAEAINSDIYIYVKSTSGNLASGTLPAGSTTVNKTFTASADDANGFVNAYTGGKSVSYTVKVVDNNISQSSRIDNALAEITSSKAFSGETDQLTFTDNSYISTPYVSRTVNLTPATLNGCACLSVACQKGDIFTLTGTPRDNSGTRPYMWVNSNNVCAYRSAQTTAFDGDEIVAPVNGTLCINFLMSEPHAVYKGIRNLHNHVVDNLNDVKNIINNPLDMLPEYLINDLAYHPLGQLSKPYLCLSCDDGSAELETYTIPMLLDKDVPCTFGLWASSSVFGESPAFSPSVVLRTQSGVDAVKSAIENGCEVAQHGGKEWTDMTEEWLVGFLAREATAFEALEIEVKGAICPSHCINNKVRAIVGGMFGSVRSGYLGYKSNEDRINNIYGDVLNPYKYFLTGARSNCYGYTSFNTNDKTLAELKTALDYAIANNLCMIVYWHDWDLTAEQKITLESFIDYAKTTTVTFTTLSKIPRLT